jgi:hypothetical protein
VNPVELLQHAVDAIESARRRGSQHEPMIQMTMVRQRRPTGRTIRMFGSQGPKGDVCLVRTHGQGWQVVATFSAVDTAKWIGRMADRALDELQRREDVADS